MCVHTKFYHNIQGIINQILNFPTLLCRTNGSQKHHLFPLHLVQLYQQPSNELCLLRFHRHLVSCSVLSDISSFFEYVFFSIWLLRSGLTPNNITTPFPRTIIPLSPVPLFPFPSYHYSPFPRTIIPLSLVPLFPFSSYHYSPFPRTIIPLSSYHYSPFPRTIIPLFLVPLFPFPSYHYSPFPRTIIPLFYHNFFNIFYNNFFHVL